MRGASRGDPEVEQPGRGGAGDAAPINPIGAGAGRPVPVSAAPAGVLRTRAPGRPRTAARRHEDRLPHVRGCTRRGRRRGGSRAGSGAHWGAPSPPGSAAEGAKNRRTWSAGGRARRSQGARRQSGGRL